jgi:hypothetical protein
LHNPFQDGKAILTSVDESVGQRQVPRVSDRGPGCDVQMEMGLCQGAHVSLKPPVREENSKAFARAPGTS